MEEEADLHNGTPEAIVLKFYFIGVDLMGYPRQGRGGQDDTDGTITIQCHWTSEEMAVALKAAAAADEEENTGTTRRHGSGGKY